MKKKLISILVSLTLCISALSGCSTTNNITTQATASKITVSAGESESVPKVDTYIELGEKVNVDGEGVSVDNNIVTINRGGTYSLSGKLEDGQIIVSASEIEKVYLVLNGVDITCSNTSAIYVKEAEKTIISLADNTENYIRDGANYELEDENDKRDAAIYSKDNLTFVGSGNLTVEGNYNDGITGKDDLKIEGGNIKVNAINDGIKGKDSLVVTGGNITVNSGQDGMKSNNDENTDKGYILIEGGTINITSGNDGIQGENNVYIRDGDVTINSGGGNGNGASHNEMPSGGMGDMRKPGEKDTANIDSSIEKMGANDNTSLENTSDSESNETSEETTSDSYKGIKADSKIIIENGNFNIDSADDSIHTNDTIIIDGGTFNLSSGDDGIHANTLVEINSGTINVNKSYEGIEGETVTINDGKIYVKATDDGINVAGGTDTEAEEMKAAQGGGPMGENPPSKGEMKGERPQFNANNALDMQNGMSNIEGEKPEAGEVGQANNQNQTQNGNNQMPGGNNSEPPSITNNKDSNNANGNDTQKPAPPSMENTQGGGGPMGAESSGTGVLNINGGYTVVDADGDGLDANGAINMTGGTMIVYGPTNDGNGALDYDKEFNITGGVLVAAGSTGMAQTPSSTSTQYILNLTLSEQEANTLVRVEDENGNEVITIAPDKKFASFVISTPDLNKGSNYKVYTGGSVDGGNEENGVYTNCNYTKGTEVISTSISEIITSATQEGVTVSNSRGGGMNKNGGMGRGNIPKN